MGLYYVIDVDNEEEFNKQLQLYFLQKFKLESNLNGTAILKKKSYSTGLLIVLILFFWPGAIIYYFTASDDVVTIKMKGSDFQQTGNAAPNQQPVSYCPNCGEGLFEDSTFCPGCGINLNNYDGSEEVKAIEAASEDEVKTAELID